MWIQLPLSVIVALTTLAFLSQIIARMGLRNQHGRIAFAIRSSADFFLGLSPVLLISVLISELCIALSIAPANFMATASLSITFFAGIYGFFRASRPDVVEVVLSSQKITRPYRFVQISDVHIGSRTQQFLQQLVDRINRLEPDFLCITGDFIDQPGITVELLSPITQIQCPIYYCTGNHERYEDFDSIMTRLMSLGVYVLRNQSILHNECQIIGIDDADSPQQVAHVLPSIPVESSRFSILLYHRPQGVEAAAEQGIDLKLSGHTHNGQIKPFDLAVKRVFEYTKGLYQHNNTFLYVNEGTGTWGPTLRLGTRSEITHFTVEPALNEQ